MTDKDPEIISRMFDNISGSYDNLNHIFSARNDLKWRRKAVNYLCSINNEYKTILDLASGTGDFAKELTILTPDLLFSVDFSYNMLLINKQKNINNNYVFCSDAEKLPFKDNSFDVVTISFGIRNFNNLEKCVKEVSRVLKINGYFIIIEMFKFNKSSIIQKLFSLYFSKIVPAVGGFISGNHAAYNYLQESVHNFYTNKEIIKTVSDCGFIINKEIRNFLNIVYTLIFKKNE